MNTLPTATTPPQIPPRPRRRHTALAVILSVLGGLTFVIVAIAIIAGVAGQHAIVRQSAVPVDTSSQTPYWASATASPSSAAPAGTVSQINALSSAQGYLQTGSFSRKGLIEQLTSKYGEGFPKADAVWAVNHLHVNWFAEAVKAARDYLSTGSFSRSGLISQLSSSYGDQFTRAQATYAVNKVGL